MLPIERSAAVQLEASVGSVPAQGDSVFRRCCVFRSPNCSSSRGHQRGAPRTVEKQSECLS
ncbi:hypothetical protein ACFPRL_20200 [Pseudoclavibacter helvolus]